MSNETAEGLPTEITLYVQTPEGFDAQVKVMGIETTGLSAWLKGASKKLAEAGFVTSSVAERNHVAVAAAKGETGPVCPDCGGPTEMKTGNGKKGPWKGWFCLKTADAPQASRHKPVWA